MRFISSLLLLIISVIAYSQDSTPIITDRPTQTASAFVVPQGSLLFEAGFIGERQSTGITNTTFFNGLLRYGVIEGIELRLTQNFVGSKVLGETNSGLSPLTLGTKIHILEEDGFRPQMSVIGQITLNNGTREFRPGSSVSEVRLNFQNTLTESLSLGYNIGMTNGSTDLFYTVVLGLAIADGWSIFVEPYGFVDDRNDVRFNTGIIYLAQPNMQFDVSFGAGISNISPNSFIAFGAAFGF